VPEVIARAYVGYFLLIGFPAVWRAEARRNNRRYVNNFYRRGVNQRSKKNNSLVFIGNPEQNTNFAPELFDSIAPQNAENSTVTNSLPLKLKKLC